MIHYYIKRNGMPDYQNALELPCLNKQTAIEECARLHRLQDERNAAADRILALPKEERGRGWAFMATKSDDVFTVGEHQTN